MTEQGRISERFRAGRLPDPSQIEDFVEHVSDMAVMVGADGVIQGIPVHPECVSLGSLDHRVGRAFSGFLTIESQAKFAERLRLIDSNPGVARRPVELNHVDNSTWEFPIRYTLHQTKDDDAILLVGRDLQPVAEVQQRFVAEQLARERDLQRLRSVETFYRAVLEASDTPLVLIEPEKGRVHDINRAAAAVLGSKPETINGNSFAQIFEGRRRDELMDALQAAAASEVQSSVMAVSRRNGHDVALTPGYFRAAGELFVLCRVDAVQEGQSSETEVADVMASLFSSASDAIVITDAKGMILDANDAFLTMTDAAQLQDVKGTVLADFLVRGTVDLKLMLDTATKAGRLNHYNTQVSSVVGGRLGVDVSVTQLHPKGGEASFGFILRDVTPEPPVESETGPSMMTEDAMKSVMDLVGTASLKDLVSATSDVVEKMCIETAIRLTDNNRVAAAEMLGLSRQSLYVKLRKHGLIDFS